ncbi:hypothetical protein CL654_00970 [bacterium]|nr:hypothetical protein [bacterium]|tara:strand:+ start:1288 stop:1947 length:660 start_codon:yes stop_codon:yes gene_type:complete
MALRSRSTQEFVPIEDIRDGVVILKNGSMRMVLMVSSINFALKSEDEQTALLLQFQNFLNSLDFSAQFFLQSRRLDINPYIESLQARTEVQKSELIKIQTREYIEFVKNFTSSINIMSKTFFVVIPYYPSVIDSGNKGLLGRFLPGKKSGGDAIKETRFEEDKIQLEQKVTIVEQGLTSVGVRTARLGTEELAELFYKSFNPGEKSGAPLGGQPGQQKK